MRRVLVVVMPVVLVVLGLTSSATAESVGSIAGGATDTSGAPLAGVAVTTYSSDTGKLGTATTGADGTFVIGDLPAGGYTVCFDPKDATGGSSPTGYRATCWRDVDSTDGPSNDRLTLVPVTDGGTASGVVQALPSTGGVSGTVTDGNGAPLAGALVSASNGPTSPPTVYGSATTDAQGRYVIRGLRPGTGYTVCVSAEGVSGGISVTGYLDQCYGGVPAQWGRVPARDGSRRFAVQAATVTALDPVALEAAARIEGVLTDGDGRPVAGVQVQGDTDGGPYVMSTGVTDADGHYVLGFGADGSGSNAVYFGTRLPDAPYRVYYNTFAVPGFVSQLYRGVQTLEGRSWIGGDATLVQPTPGRATRADDTLTAAATIAGTVTDGQGSGLRVDVALWHGNDYLSTGSSDSTGRFAFGRLPAGAYRLCFGADSTTGGHSAAGYLDSCRSPVSVTAGQHRTGVDHALQAASGISGYLYGPSFEPLAYRGGVRLYQDGVPGYANASTDGDGRYLFSRLPAGTYKVCFDVNLPPRWQGCYDGGATLANATPITTSLGDVVTGINGQASDKPDTTAPTASMTRPAALVQTGRAIALSIATADAGSGVASYDLRYRYADWDDRAFSAYRSPSAWQHRTGAAPAVTGAPGRTYCFSVRARDGVGNVSPYSPEKCATVPLDDRALRSTSGTWTRARSAYSLEGTVTRTSSLGATLTLTGAYADRVGLVVTTCPGCGQVGVYVNGSLVDTVSTWSRTVRKKVLVLPRTFGYRAATIALRLRQRDRALLVDGLAVTRR